MELCHKMRDQVRLDCSAIGASHGANTKIPTCVVDGAGTV